MRQYNRGASLRTKKFSSSLSFLGIFLQSSPLSAASRPNRNRVVTVTGWAQSTFTTFCVSPQLEGACLAFY